MSDKNDTVEITIRVPGDTFVEIATECYCCCGHASNEAISRMASLILHHSWQDISCSDRHPYWLSSIFAEIEEL